MKAVKNKALIKSIQQPFKWALDVVLPQTCLGCRTVVKTPDFTSTLCAVCWGQLHSADMLAETMQQLAEESDFDSFAAPFLYEGMAMNIVKALKFGGHRAAARLMAQQMLPYLEGEIDLIMPVPLHKKRLYRRAYNQSADLVKHLSRLANIPADFGTLERTRHTQSQVGQKAEVRRAQLKDAFKAVGDVKGKRIALVDDVCTTGSTAHECAKALKDAGAMHIQLLTFAYVEPKVN